MVIVIKIKLKYCHFGAHSNSAPNSEQTMLLCFHTLCMRDFTALAKIRELVHVWSSESWLLTNALSTKIVCTGLQISITSQRVGYENHHLEPQHLLNDDKL